MAEVLAAAAAEEAVVAATAVDMAEVAGVVAGVVLGSDPASSVPVDSGGSSGWYLRRSNAGDGS